MKDQEGNLLVGHEDIAQWWTQYFTTLLNVPENMPTPYPGIYMWAPASGFCPCYDWW